MEWRSRPGRYTTLASAPPNSLSTSSAAPLVRRDCAAPITPLRAQGLPKRRTHSHLDASCLILLLAITLAYPIGEDLSGGSMLTTASQTTMAGKRRSHQGRPAFLQRCG